MPEAGPDTKGASAPQPTAEERPGREQPPAAEEQPRTSWVFYGLGLSLQTFLWFLLFLAIIVAVAVGGKLTEFRYIGF